MRSARTPPQLANEVRLKRSQHRGAFLLVEGPDDSRFYRRFIDAKECHLVVAFEKENVVSAIRLLDVEGFAGVVGLVDSDFGELDGKDPESANIVRGECHDLEAMLVRSPALEAVLHEHASPDKLAQFEQGYGGPLRNWLTDTGRCLGYLRWNSLNLGLNLRFEGLHFSRFVDPRSLTLNPSQLRTEIRNHSQNWQISEEQLIVAGWPTTGNEDPWHLCCGHDLVELLTLALRRAVGSCQHLGQSNLSSALRVAYSSHDFQCSRLSGTLRDWETRTGFRILAP